MLTDYSKDELPDLWLKLIVPHPQKLNGQASKGVFTPAVSSLFKSNVRFPPRCSLFVQVSTQ